MITDPSFGKKREDTPSSSLELSIDKEGAMRRVSLAAFEAMSGAPFIPQLDFDDFSLFLNVHKRLQKLHKKGKLTPEQLWLGSYYRSEILAPSIPDVVLKWIDPAIGWGVFAARDFKKREYIAEYGGKLRKRRRSDKKNAYCFEYIAAPGIATPYTVDAREQGGIGRYINHSGKPNLLSALATVDGINHIIFIVKEPVAKGEQLLYDYGADYWKARSQPLELISAG